MGIRADKKEHYASMTNAQLVIERDHAWRIEEMLNGSKGLQTTLRVARIRSTLIGEEVMARMIQGTLILD